MPPLPPPSEIVVQSRLPCRQQGALCRQQGVLCRQKGALCRQKGARKVTLSMAKKL